MGLFVPTPVPADEVASIVDQKLTWILSACTPAEVRLFGSAATGAMTEASDIDLALIFHDRAEIRDSRQRLSMTPRLSDWPQDLVWFQADDFYERAQIGGLPMIILQEGRRLYPGGKK